MSLLGELLRRCPDPDRPFLLGRGASLSLRDIAAAPLSDLSSLRAGDVVALIGAFDPLSISTLLRLLDRGVIVAPLTPDSEARHDEFFAQAFVSACIRAGRVEQLPPVKGTHPGLDYLRQRGEGGLILFSSGTTGGPKAILHAAPRLLASYHKPGRSLRALAFLLFDHIGGLNTLLHMLFNNGEVVVPRSLSVEDVAADLQDYAVELLPTTPTFLRLLLLSGILDEDPFPALKLISYGTELMDQPTLDALCKALPTVDFRQTYGMSELGILRVQSKARDSLWMRLGGEGVRAQVRDGLLYIHSGNRMLGYLNAPSPFDKEGWYCTQDMAENEGPWFRIKGRQSGLINVGGLKVLPAEVEKAALLFPGVALVKAMGAPNPVSGEHVELICQFAAPFASGEEQKRVKAALREHLQKTLPASAVPLRIRLENVPLNYRYKKK
ncbi:MAG: fatty acid--CoA ligase family protein [Desulfovibrio sp.]|nr:fatty acid--CoA ligase family protein [Desulfovibrio sp.]